MTRPSGYALDLSPEDLDGARFAQLLAEARRAREEQRQWDALAAFDDALALWRGPALADLSLEGEAGTEAARLDELRVGASEERIDLALGLGLHRDLIPELEQLVVTHPLRERFRAQLMLAYYRSGRQADALRAYREARLYLSSELGIEPGPELQELERGILRQDASLVPPTSNVAPAAASLPSARRRRRFVIGAAGAAVATAIVIVVAFLLNLGRNDDSLRARSVAVLDQREGAVVADVRMPALTGSIVVTPRGVWVADGPDRAVIQIDPYTLQVTRTIGVGSIPYRLSAGGGALWIAEGYDGTLRRFDLADRRLSRPFRPGPRSTGRLALAYGAGSLWVGSQDNAVSRLDPPSGRLVAQVRGVSSPEAIAVGDGGVWIAEATRAELVRVDVRTNRVVRSIPIGGIATAVAAGNGAIWAVTPAERRLWRVDPRSNAVTAAIDVGTEPSAVALAGDDVWVASAADGTLTQVDARRNKLVRTLRLGHPIGGLAASNGRLWVSLR